MCFLIGLVRAHQLLLLLLLLLFMHWTETTEGFIFSMVRVHHRLFLPLLLSVHWTEKTKGQSKSNNNKTVQKQTNKNKPKKQQKILEIIKIHYLIGEGTLAPTSAADVVVFVLNRKQQIKQNPKRIYFSCLQSFHQTKTRKVVWSGMCGKSLIDSFDSVAIFQWSWCTWKPSELLLIYSSLFCTAHVLHCC